jgi:hypothetical protein
MSLLNILVHELVLLLEKGILFSAVDRGNTRSERMRDYDFVGVVRMSVTLPDVHHFKF